MQVSDQSMFKTHRFQPCWEEMQAGLIKGRYSGRLESYSYLYNTEQQIKCKCFISGVKNIPMEMVEKVSFAGLFVTYEMSGAGLKRGWDGYRLEDPWATSPISLPPKSVKRGHWVKGGEGAVEASTGHVIVVDGQFFSPLLLSPLPLSTGDETGNRSEVKWKPSTPLSNSVERVLYWFDKPQIALLLHTSCCWHLKFPGLYMMDFASWKSQMKWEGPAKWEEKGQMVCFLLYSFPAKFQEGVI